MFGFKRIVIAQNERGLLLKDRSIEKVLLPGIYRIFDIAGRFEVVKFDLVQPRFSFRLADYLINEKPALVDQYFELVELGDYQVGLVYQKDKLIDLLAPNSRQLYWKGFADFRVEVQDIRDEFALAADKVGPLARARAGDLPGELLNAAYIAEVADNMRGLLIVDGELRAELRPGLYAYWKYNRAIKVEQIDLRQQAMEVQGQEILTRDRVSLRVNLSAQYQVIDAVAARNQLVNFSDYLYRELQFALRQVIGTRNLDALLANKGELDAEIFRLVSAKLDDLGLSLRSVGVKDVILPGEMKVILNQVVEAEKVAQANVIKRREETAATRSLLNTAKLMDDNPTLMRLKELEVLEKVTEKVDKLTVFGGLEGVLKDTVQIRLNT
ncbi:MAG: slipin family protein [Gammaproteobacteria bacterium]|nr:slipin family protein [Gammaproteobacteria bacterium]